MLWILASLMAQIGVDAGPAPASCGGSIVTLAASPVNPPARFEIQWEDAPEPGIFLVVTPLETTEYRVFLTDLDTDIVYEATTRVLVHPGSPDLFSDGILDSKDWGQWFAAWGEAPPDEDYDPDRDQVLTLLDWFYFCNLVDFPENTPPSLTVEATTFTFESQSVSISYEANDAEQQPLLVIARQPDHGFVNVINGILRYLPDEQFVGNDSFEVAATDGRLTTLPETVAIEVLPPDNYTDLLTDIFEVHCWACHINASEGGLNLSTYDEAETGGNSGPAFIPFEPNLSPLYDRVVSDEMPLGRDPLSQLEKERIRDWIQRGARRK
ncbi:PSCyt1 domain-containing protein [Sulfidibacter corallicola]|uniref:Cytochrome C Planctomycete-type domain-containing protein n=1 Tax=Sulfidibacter corallicola TaxID=2818388 RepID=A0A8A4TP00_SULCO|nr:c-type cytochrome domain-containing protein [Sulfidibacter corallicola]QTD51273.1 hypothetical protein J3U87_02295 [Sulfidibacter corallicola]